MDVEIGIPQCEGVGPVGDQQAAVGLLDSRGTVCAVDPTQPRRRLGQLSLVVIMSAGRKRFRVHIQVQIRLESVAKTKPHRIGVAINGSKNVAHIEGLRPAALQRGQVLLGIDLPTQPGTDGDLPLVPGTEVEAAVEDLGQTAVLRCSELNLSAPGRLRGPPVAQIKIQAPAARSLHERPAPRQAYVRMPEVPGEGDVRGPEVFPCLVGEDTHRADLPIAAVGPFVILAEADRVASEDLSPAPFRGSAGRR